MDSGPRFCGTNPPRTHALCWACLWALASSLANACGGSAIHGGDGSATGGAGGTGGTGGTGGVGGGGGYGGGVGCPIPIPCCGDGLGDPGEECDDRNQAAGDGCNGLCQVEANWTCFPWGACEKRSLCGDGVLTSDEVCDDGPALGQGGCAVDCQTILPGWICPFPGRPCRPVAPSVAIDGGAGAAPICGNGVLEPGEACDDGAANDDRNYGGCTTQCKLGERCGDGQVNGPGEECDLGPANGIRYGDPNGCTAGCRRAHFCGDGIPDPEDGEACDLGAQNGGFGQGCDPHCQLVSQSSCYLLCI